MQWETIEILREQNKGDSSIKFYLLIFVFFLFIELIGMTLLNKIIQVSGAQIPHHTICMVFCVYHPSQVSVHQLQ